MQYLLAHSAECHGYTAVRLICRNHVLVRTHPFTPLQRCQLIAGRQLSFQSLSAAMSLSAHRYYIYATVRKGQSMVGSLYMFHHFMSMKLCLPLCLNSIHPRHPIKAKTDKVVYLADESISPFLGLRSAAAMNDH